ncbi:MAG: ribosome recycling factor [Clostridia bacterium]|nr:ribosome recycling factor [Clostridia bacterium]
MKLDIRPYEEKMKKSISVYKDQLDTIRAGRANVGVLRGIDVEYYGTPTAINQMAEVKLADARTLMITPWDVSTVKTIEKALLASDIGITPQSDGRVIRLVFPQPTGERRKEMTKQVSKMGEEAKVSIRNIRRDAIDAAKNEKKAGTMTEDEQKASEKSVQDLTDKYIKEVDAVTAAKNAEIMEV